MKQLKKTILTLALLIAATTQAWADYTVTWEGTKLQSINVSKGYTINVTTETMNVDGITVTANKGFFYYGGYTMHFGSGEADGIVFSAENNIKSIAITSTNSSIFIPGGSFQDGGTHTYELNPAAKSYGFGKGVHIDGVTKIVITLESPVTFTRGTGDKANTWTMDGGMPAGNVIVNAEYYQDAAFAMSTGTTPVALAPTANNSAKANTDDPLVTGGEVANIVEGTEALEAKQGTLMYYFDKTKATTLMTAAQLEALTADEWSDKVPTADGLHFDAATDVFVYYYIKGADDVAGLADGVKHTFSDSDPVCLTVSVQKEPTFKVELNAEGLTTAEAANWKAAKGSATPAAFPLTGVKKDDNVTVTYTGSRKVIGVKAEKKFKLAAEATTADKGKLICTDGHIHDYGKDAECTAARVAKIVYIGATNVYTYDHGLALALADEGQMSSGDASTACGIDKNSSTPVRDALWFLPSKDYWDLLLGPNGAGSYTALRDGFESVGGTNMLSAKYLSSSLDENYDKVWIFDFSNGNWQTIDDFGSYFRAALVF